MISSGFVQCVTLEDKHSVDLLRRSANLDAGESEAIILADSVSNLILLIDEEKGRRVARNMGLSITWAIGVLVNAYEEGFVDIILKHCRRIWCSISGVIPLIRFRVKLKL